MPKPIEVLLYDLAFNMAKTVFKQTPLTSRTVSFTKGDAVYRYGSYIADRPQLWNEVLKVWQPLSKDNNRWTGTDGKGGGSQGLYTSNEFLFDKDFTFAEMKHYMTQALTDTPLDPQTPVEYMHYEAGKAPQAKMETAGNLRSVFLYTFNQPQDGLNLRFTADPMSYPQLIYKNMLKEGADIVKGRSLEDLYLGEDYSFTRAVGNAAFETFDLPCIQVSSAREIGGFNTIFRCDQGQMVLDVEPQGRASGYQILKDGSPVVRQAYTMDDLTYNAQFDQPESKKLVPLPEQLEVLSPLEKTVRDMSKKVDWSFEPTTVDKAVADSVNRQLSSMDTPFDTSVTELNKTMQDGVMDSVASALTKTGVSLIAPEPGFTDLVTRIQVSGVATLFQSQMVKERLAKLTEEVSGGPGYLQTVTDQVLLEKKQHLLSQEAGTIQATIAEAGTARQETSASMETKNQQLKEVEEKLKSKPDDPDLKKSQQELTRELADLTDKLKAEDEKYTKAEEAQKSNETARKEAEEKSKEAAERRAALKDHVFEGK
ncbi:hypothetical protein [Desulfoluna butyratoxydans]|uniref:Uncharacterized protein n=1 Tax=Desulfoluna butyratoxydans TaxID=231438 RepID=A0A4U8YNR8_9BACT|nr:hypothetical protein [Desulfoluna butyratoxydans]VFQ45450.1 hypothetical protein MSL71_31070 [Desulfoluna butyratoxydans]